MVTPPLIDDTCTCPYCLETIRTGAIKCRHCGEFLDERGPSKPAGGFDPRIAGVLSFFIVGAGQVYKGDFRRGAELFAIYFLCAIGVTVVGMFPPSPNPISSVMALVAAVLFLLAMLWAWGYGIYNAISTPASRPNWWAH